MRIGIFTDRYLPQTDGVSVSVETFRCELEKLGHEVYIFAPKPTWEYEEKTDRVIRFTAIKGFFSEDWLTSLFFPPQAIRQIDKLHLDIIHFHTPAQVGLLGAYYALHKNVPLVTTYHTDLVEYVKHYPQALPGLISLSLIAPLITGGGSSEYRLALSSIKPEKNINVWNQKIVIKGLTLLHDRCDLVIVPSVKFQKQLKSWKTRSKIAILPTGVDKITTTKEEIEGVREKYNISSTDQIILLVCRVGTEKNISLLLDAFEIIAKELPNSKLFIIGPGNDLEHFKKIALRSAYSERIIFTGYVERQHLGKFYAIASIFAFPSVADTQGLAVNEATCAGLPIVMVDRKISEVLVDGQNGFYAKNNAKDFASKIIKILKSSKLHKAMSARSIILGAKVSSQAQAQKLIELYQEIIK